MTVITGATSYKGYTAQQHESVFEIFDEFLKEIKPARILEIGTAGGGFTLFLRDTLDSIGLHTTIIESFDVIESSWYNTLREHNININIENIFNSVYTKLECPDRVVPFIQSEGTTLVLCDGGHKIAEFNELAPYIKINDFIMAHDYVDTWENYKENYVDKIWNWCELEEKYIAQVSSDHNLVPYNKEKFDKVVWVCKKKV